MTTRIKAVLLASGLALAVSAPPALAQTPTEFTYQGVLTGPGGPVTTSVEIVFLLFDAPVNGNIQGDPIAVNLTPVDGVFTVPLDFGAEAFATNQPLWLQMDVTDNSNPNNSDSFRQPLTSAPYALNTRGLHVDEDSVVSIGEAGDPTGFRVFGDMALFGTGGGLTLIDTGLFFDGVWDISQFAGRLEFNESNIGSRLTITPGGNVGIGTDAPSMLLDLGGFGLDKPTSNNRGLYSSSPNEFVEFSGNNATALSADVFLDLITGGTARIEVRSAATTVTNDLIVNGEVFTPDRIGVGVEFPGSRLSLARDSNGHLLGFGVGGRDEYLFRTIAGSNELILTRSFSDDSSRDVMKWSENGDVGIGTVGGPSFDAMLEIRGSNDGRLPLKVDVSPFPGAPELAAEFVGGVKVRGDLDVGENTLSVERIAGVPAFDGAPPGFVSIDSAGLGVGSIMGVGSTLSNGETQLVVKADNVAFRTSIFKALNAGFQTVFDIRSNGQTFCNGALLCSSDASMKNSITGLEGSLDAVLALRGVAFHWNDDQPMHGAGEQIGFIAQEVEAVLPQLVSEADNGTKAVQYDKMTAVLVEAVKQQQAHITELTSRVNELESSASPGLFRSSVLWPMIAIGGIGGLALRRKTAPAS